VLLNSGLYSAQNLIIISEYLRNVKVRKLSLWGISHRICVIRIISNIKEPLRLLTECLKDLGVEEEKLHTFYFLSINSLVNFGIHIH
jgi:hypothetical protein